MARRNRSRGQGRSRSRAQPLWGPLFLAVGLLFTWCTASYGGSSARFEASPRSLNPSIREARDLAFARLQHRGTCRSLFETMGADGARLLERATFRLATAIERSKICRHRRAALFTTVGGTEIAVCPREFRKLKTEHRAALLIHEALHHAGVSEQPLDPDGLTSSQLTQLVERRCSL